MSTGGGKAAIDAWLGHQIVMEGGGLRFEGTLRIDGEVLDGSLSGPTLVIGESARVTGSIDVDRLEVYGRVDARAKVGSSATIAPGGLFEGEMVLREPALSVEEGGRFKGKVRMESAS